MTITIQDTYFFLNMKKPTLPITSSKKTQITGPITIFSMFDGSTPVHKHNEIIYIYIIGVHFQTKLCTGAVPNGANNNYKIK